MKKFLYQLNIAPNTLVGLLVVAFGYLTFTLKYDGKAELPGYPKGLLFALREKAPLTKLILWLRPFWLGLTLGQCIFLAPDATKISKSTIPHELVHVRQQSKLGLWFFISYTLSSIRHGYWENKYELEAYNETNPKRPLEDLNL